ncbi:Fe2+/Pb2+ permease [Actinobacillus arthritidis]|uniref:Fe2+/Pb2+ permease n=1 Tax=Actinobacillus arthritidis TaxID=157339 RepID=UPI002441564A|nr:Fe2+/Pb2+ permease [Actinobacillus arthritidis]WGE89970.1 Fe2+/Pb2+ permease [Actinobacillus arthritidis]
MTFKKLIIIPLLFASSITLAKVDVSPLFVQLSEAMAELKKGKITKSQQNLTALQQAFNQFQVDSEVSKNVANALNQAIKTTDVDNLENVAKHLYRFEKAQNPVDYAAKQQTFVKQMVPLYQNLRLAVQTQKIKQIRMAASHFGKNWAKYEKPIREMSLTHYGKFERSLGLMRIAITAEKPDMAKIERRVAELGKVMAEFSQFKVQ